MPRPARAYDLDLAARLRRAAVSNTDAYTRRTLLEAAVVIEDHDRRRKLANEEIEKESKRSERIFFGLIAAAVIYTGFMLYMAL